jgi:hypothetical protein
MAKTCGRSCRCLLCKQLGASPPRPAPGGPPSPNFRLLKPSSEPLPEEEAATRSLCRRLRDSFGYTLQGVYDRAMGDADFGPDDDGGATLDDARATMTTT